jgi:tetrapyrrole methylase family protein/MazG family protein
MTRILRLSESPLSESLLGELRQAKAVYHLAPEHPSFGALAAAGIDCRPAPDVLPDGAEWIVLPTSHTLDTGDERTFPELRKLVWIVDRLLGPGGCPWDQAQTHESLKRHLLEEAYEVLDAIDSGSEAKFQEELGDLILQPIMHAQMKALAGGFDIEDVARTINEKLLRRHPHVFGSLEAADADEVLKNWDRIKQQEKGGEEPASILEGVPKGMASLLRAYEVSKRAARSGFEWPDIEAVFEKLREEEAELREELPDGPHERIEGEVGDLLFTAVNIARWAKVEPEEALRKMLNRFTERFMAMERASKKPLSELSPEDWDELWEAAKREGD